MAKLKSTLPNMLLSLTGICLVAGAILAGVNQFTAGPIAVAKATALEEAIKAVAPEFDNKPTEDVYMAVSSDGDSLKIYPAKKGGQVVGGAVESNTKKGFKMCIRDSSITMHCIPKQMPKQGTSCSRAYLIAANLPSIPLCPNPGAIKIPSISFNCSAAFSLFNFSEWNKCKSSL